MLFFYCVVEKDIKLKYFFNLGILFINMVEEEKVWNYNVVFIISNFLRDWDRVKYKFIINKLKYNKFICYINSY